MSLPSWPLDPFLPDDPLVSGYQMEAIDELLRTEMDVGPSRTRRRFGQMQHRLSFTMVMTASQFMIMKGFYAESLRHGVLQFDMPVFRGDIFTTERVQFEQPYTANDLGLDLISVSMVFVVFDLVA